MNQNGPQSLDDINYIVLSDKRLFTKKILVIAERVDDAESLDGTILDEVLEVHDLWGYWDEGAFVRNQGEFQNPNFCMQVIKIFKWDLKKFDERMGLMRRRMEWKYPGYKRYCAKVFQRMAMAIKGE